MTDVVNALPDTAAASAGLAPILQPTGLLLVAPSAMLLAARLAKGRR